MSSLLKDLEGERVARRQQQGALNPAAVNRPAGVRHRREQSQNQHQDSVLPDRPGVRQGRTGHDGGSGQMRSLIGADPDPLPAQGGFVGGERTPGMSGSIRGGGHARPASAGRSRSDVGHGSRIAEMASGVADTEAYRCAPAGGRDTGFRSGGCVTTAAAFRGMSRSRVVSHDNPFVGQVGGGHW